MIEKVQEQLIAAIIAGGKSTRFGESKIGAHFKSRTLLDYAIRLASEISNNYMIISNQQIFLPNRNLVTIPDRIPHCGPLGGIYTALYHSSAPWIATIPCDMPLLVAEVFDVLYANRQLDTPIVARSKSGVEPLVAIWPKTALPFFEQAIKNANYKIYRLLSLLHSKEISIPDALPDYRNEWFFNVNSKDDLKKLEGLASV